MASTSASIASTTSPRSRRVSGRSSISVRAIPAIPCSRRRSERSGSTSVTTGTFQRGRAYSDSTARRSSSIHPRPSPGCPSTSGSSSNRRMPSPTAISSARSTAWVSRRPGTSASSTARATSAIRADASSPKAAATRTSWLSRISTSISSRRSGTPGSSIGTAALKPTAALPRCNFFQSGGQENVSLLIKNGRVITACDDYVADVYCEDGTIAAIGKDLPLHRYQAERTIDAAGQYVLPGGIDVHTHLDMPFGGTTSTDDFETGTIAAAFGGTTCLVDFAIQYRGQTMRHALDEWMKKASGKAAADYSFHMIVTELPDAGLGDMDTMVRNEGITSFKLFMAYPGVFMVDDATIFRALRRTGENGGASSTGAGNPAAATRLRPGAPGTSHNRPTS